MKLVLLSGGSGKRLWPMSNDSRSKQFLKCLVDDKGNKISMLQRVWSQLGNIGLQNDAYICASKAQSEMIEAQVGVVPFIEEPGRRDTFPAIALATTYLIDELGCSDDEVIVVLPIDPMVDDSFFRELKSLDKVLLDSKADIVLMGVKPSEPSSKFGYIKVTDKTRGKWMYVDSFVEKPNSQLAKQLISSGALWNCGVFCFKIEYLKQVLQNKAVPLSYSDLVNSFSSIAKQSFDYEVVEKTKNIAVYPYEGTWKDLGTWETLSTEISSNFVGNGEAIHCVNTHVINELGIPLLAAGLQNTIVVATPDGILVSDKGRSSSIKSIVELYGNRPMFEERIWGSYRVLDFQKASDGAEVLTRCIKLLPGKNISYQKHMRRSEIWTILDGEGEVILDSRIRPIHAGDIVCVNAGQWHAICATGELTFIEVQRGSELIEEDIMRSHLKWEDIIAHCKALAY
jgi:mannose-1-phosphate guanylyltransferase